MGSLFCCLGGPAFDQEHADSDDDEQIQASDATNYSVAHAGLSILEFINRSDALLGRGSMGSRRASSFLRDERGVNRSRVEPELDFESKALIPQISMPEEDGDISKYDECLICLEEYTSENPRITTKCSHYYHLSCMLEWQQRSEFCPICCSKVMEYEEMSSS